MDKPEDKAGQQVAEMVADAIEQEEAAIRLASEGALLKQKVKKQTKGKGKTVDDEDEDEEDPLADVLLLGSQADTVPEPPPGAGLFRNLAKPARVAHMLLGVPLDPYVVRPQDVLRRAFDELAFALHYFVVGAMVASQGKIHFEVKDELVSCDNTLVCGLPKITRKQGQNPVYKLGQPKQWRNIHLGYRLDGGADAEQFRKFRTSIHSHEVGYLLQHVARVSKFAYGNPRSPPYLFGPDTSRLASKLFLLRNYLTHRNFLAEGNNHCRKVAAVGEQIFTLVFKLLEDERGLQSEGIESIFVAQPFKEHVNNLHNLRMVFHCLNRTFYAPKHHANLDSECRAKLRDSVLAHLKGRDTGPVLAPEYFAVVYVASRFSRGRGEDEAEKASQEVDAEVSDGWNQSTAEKKSFFHIFPCARYSYTDGDTLKAKPFYSLDPFSVTHVDLLNRAFDYLVLALKEVLHQGISRADRPPAFFLAAHFILDNVHGQLLEPHGELNLHLDAISKKVVLWKRCDHEGMTMLEHFRTNLAKGQKKATTALYGRLLKESPYANDPRYLLEFINRALGATQQTSCSAEGKRMLGVFRDLIKDCTFLNPLMNYLSDMISFRDCLGHQANLVHATKLRMSVVLDVIERMIAIQTMARDLFLGDRASQPEEWFALLPELASVLKPPLQGRGKRPLSDYAAFRQRQQLTQRPELRAKLRSNAEEIIKHLIELPGDDDSFQIVRCQTMLVDKPPAPHQAARQKKAVNFTNKTWFSSLGSLGEADDDAVEAEEKEEEEEEEAKKQKPAKGGGGGRGRGGRGSGSGRGGRGRGK